MKVKNRESIKRQINYLINFRCANCQDGTFCKIPAMVKSIENPDLKTMNYISRCLFYKKKAV